jgi:putative acetyltransferase
VLYSQLKFWFFWRRIDLKDENKMKQTEYSVREASKDDLGALTSLFSETILNTCRNEYSQEQLQAWAKRSERRERWLKAIEEQYFIMIEADNKLLGFGSLKDSCYIDFMYVHKDHLRRGIAHLIYTHLEREALRNGALEVTSDVSKTARPFFEAKGFIVEKENTHDLDGVSISNYAMRNKLQG